MRRSGLAVAAAALALGFAQSGLAGVMPGGRIEGPFGTRRRRGLAAAASNSAAQHRRLRPRLEALAAFPLEAVGRTVQALARPPARPWQRGRSSPATSSAATQAGPARVDSFRRGLVEGFARLGLTDLPVVVAGYSYGASLAFYYAANARRWGLPIPRAVFSVFPAGLIYGAVLPALPESVRVLIQVGDRDAVAGQAGAQPFWAWLASHPPSRKRLEIVRSRPLLTATHAAPKLEHARRTARLLATARCAHRTRRMRAANRRLGGSGEAGQNRGADACGHDQPACGGGDPKPPTACRRRRKASECEDACAPEREPGNNFDSVEGETGCDGRVKRNSPRPEGKCDSAGCNPQVSRSQRDRRCQIKGNRDDQSGSQRPWNSKRARDRRRGDHPRCRRHDCPAEQQKSPPGRDRRAPEMHRGDVPPDARGAGDEQGRRAPPRKGPARPVRQRARRVTHRSSRRRRQGQPGRDRAQR